MSEDIQKAFLSAPPLHTFDWWPFSEKETESLMDAICRITKGKKPMDKVILYKNKAGKWEWTRTAENNRVVGASSEGYSNFTDCYQNLLRQQADFCLDVKLDKEAEEMEEKMMTYYANQVDE